MAYFELIVTSNANTTEPIKFEIGQDSNTIKDVQFFMNTLNDKTLNRAQSVRPEFIIKGAIDENSKIEIQKLAAWAIATEKDKIYRNRNIVVKDNVAESGATLRRYNFDDMFVIDYKETFNQIQDSDNGSKDDEGKFELFIAQKEKGKVKEVLPN